MLAASTDAGATAVATLPMGILGTADATFWQLFSRGPTGRWILATPPNVATNGGVVVAQGTDRSLAAGVLPSNALRFSPLARSRDLGRTWVPGVAPGALAPAPDVLAIEGDATYAVLRSGIVVVTREGGAAWSTVAARRSIDAPVQGGCRLAALTALATPRDGVVVGGRCASTTHVPLFRETGRGWRALGPTLASRSSATALRVVAMAGELVTVVEIGSGSSRAIVGAVDARGVWSVSSPFSVSGGAVVSTAVSARGVGFVYERSGSRTFRSWAPVRGPSWEDATLPAGTTDVTWAPSGALQALSPRRAVLTVFDETAAHTWDPIQTILVPISIGTPH